MTAMTLRRPLGQRWRSASGDRKNVVYAVAPERVKGFQWNLRRNNVSCTRTTNWSCSKSLGFEVQGHRRHFPKMHFELVRIGCWSLPATAKWGQGQGHDQTKYGQEGGGIHNGWSSSSVQEWPKWPKVSLIFCLGACGRLIWLSSALIERKFCILHFFIASRLIYQFATKQCKQRTVGAARVLPHRELVVVQQRGWSLCKRRPLAFIVRPTIKFSRCRLSFASRCRLASVRSSL